MTIKKIFIVIHLFCLHTILNGQTLNVKDSLEVCRITNDFFDWYIKAINREIDSAFCPKFVESKNGMTTLDFEEYFENLKKHHFSDALIKKERQSYNDCLRNLEKIKFEDFKNRMTSVADYEDISCDFENYYRWIGGQEQIDGIRIKNVKMISKTQVTVSVEYFVDNGGSFGVTYWGNNHVTIVKIKNSWKIDDVDWRNE